MVLPLRQLRMNQKPRWVDNVHRGRRGGVARLLSARHAPIYHGATTANRRSFDNSRSRNHYLGACDDHLISIPKNDSAFGNRRHCNHNQDRNEKTIHV